MTSTAQHPAVSPSAFTEFDIVIVGGGLSGLVLAGRLSENPNVSVGVLESGPWRLEDPKITIPARAVEMFGDPEYQALTDTVPQKHVGGRKLMCPRGRVLGGGSSVNFMVWHQASQIDYDSFEALGNTGWNFDSLSKAGRRSETFHPPDAAGQHTLTDAEGRFHGKNGPVQTMFSGWNATSQKAFIDVMGKFGLAKNLEWHNGKVTGLRPSASSVDPITGTRSSSAVAYYLPNASRPNLTVICEAHANKVELEKRADVAVATGVHYVHKGQKHFVKAKKEVIVCTGALDSPKLLELSGVGNPEILKPLGIDVKVDNPNVGENLQDHMIAFMTYLLKPGHETQDAMSDPEFAKAAAATYAAIPTTQNRGPLGGTISACHFVPVKHVFDQDEIGELKQKLLKETAPLAGNEGIKYYLDVLDDPEQAAVEWTYIALKFPGPVAPIPGRSYITFMVAFVHPISRGNTHITSADPNVHSAVDPHYLESSWDKALLVHGMKKIDRASRVEPLASMLETRIEPAAGDDSLAAFEKYMTDTVIAGVHWVGTNSMLPKEKGGVVDTRCKVYGTANLRVVDASIIPLHISAHPMATLYAMAERAAELIAEDHKNA